SVGLIVGGISSTTSRFSECMWVFTISHEVNTMDASLTINEFCAVEKISRSQLYEDWQSGTGPDFFLVGSHRRISHEARERWRCQREAAVKHARSVIEASHG